MPTHDLSTIEGRMDGRTCLVTGANSGLGKALSIELARRGAAVIMGCRREYTQALAEVRHLSGSGNVSLRVADLASLASVQRFCDGLRDDGTRLDVALFNAGMSSSRNQLSEDGFSLVWQVNYLSHALMTRQLLQDGVIHNRTFCSDAERSDDAPMPRLIYTSSNRHRMRLSINFERFGTLPDYSILDIVRVYGLTKLTLMTWAWELGRRLHQNGVPEAGVFAFCPGSFRSGIGADIGWLGSLVMSTRPVSPQKAAWPGVFLACSPSLEGKTQVYYRKRQRQEPDPRVADALTGRRLWEETEQVLEA